MPERINNNSIGADKRYYHFVVVKAQNAKLASYWRRLHELGKVKESHFGVPNEVSRFVMEHRRLLYEKGYGRGAVAQLLSERGNGRSPFLYDMFAAKIQFREDTYLAFGFPFAGLAVEVIDFLLETRFLANAEFQGVELSRFLSEDNRPLKPFDGLTSRYVGVQFIVTDDKSLAAVRLGGDDPFHSEVYEFFLKRKFEQGALVPDQCVLACERDIAPHKGANIHRGILRSRLHVDKSGNFKFYMHAGCQDRKSVV